MDLYNVHTKILTPFTVETINLLDSMADLQGTPATAYQDNIKDFAFKGFAVAVIAKTFGSIEGKIIMHYSHDIALTIGKRICAEMLGEEPDTNEMTEDVVEAVSEFTNTIIGLATRTLSESNLHIRFNPPIFIQNDSDMRTLMEGVKEIFTIPISVPKVGDFYFSYLLHKVTE